MFPTCNWLGVFPFVNTAAFTRLNVFGNGPGRYGNLKTRNCVDSKWIQFGPMLIALGRDSVLTSSTCFQRPIQYWWPSLFRNGWSPLKWTRSRAEAFLLSGGEGRLIYLGKRTRENNLIGADVCFLPVVTSSWERNGRAAMGSSSERSSWLPPLCPPSPPPTQRYRVSTNGRARCRRRWRCPVSTHRFLGRFFSSLPDRGTVFLL